MSGQQVKRNKYFQISALEVDELNKSGLTANGIICYLYLRTIESFGDNYRVMPTKRELAEYLGVSIATVRRILKDLKKLKLFAVDTRNRIKSAFKNLKKVGSQIRDKFFCPDQDCKKSDNSDRERSRLQQDDQDCNFQDLEPPPDKPSEIPQTDQTVHTPQTGGRADEKVNKEQPREVETELTNESTEQREKISQQNESKKDKNPRFVIYQDLKIPLELIEKLREVGVNTRSERIMSAISNHDISQAYGAAAHIERTSDTVRNPDAVFLHQISKQPIERMGVRVPYETVDQQKLKLQEIEEERKNPEYQKQVADGLSSIMDILQKANEKRQKNRRQEPSGG